MTARPIALASLAGLLALLTLLAFLRVPAAAQVAAQAPTFVPRVVVTPLDQQGPLPQDVTGVVVDRYGNALPGVRVRISAAGWEAYDSTKGNGAFRFTLNEGRYSLQLPDRDSQPAIVQVDGWSTIWVEFKEVATQVTPPRTPTASPTLTPTETPTPTPIAMTPEARLLPSPTAAATVRAVGTPGPSASPWATSTPTGRSSPVSVLSLEYWIQPLLYGAGLGAVIALLAAVIFVFRRR